MDRSLCFSFASLQFIGILQKGVYTLLWYPDFCGCQGTPPCHLALGASGAYVHRFHGTITNGESVLKQLVPPEQRKREQTQELNHSVKEVNCFIITATDRVADF